MRGVMEIVHGITLVQLAFLLRFPYCDFTFEHVSANILPQVRLLQIHVVASQTMKSSFTKSYTPFLFGRSKSSLRYLLVLNTELLFTVVVIF